MICIITKLSYFFFYFRSKPPHFHPLGQIWPTNILDRDFLRIDWYQFGRHLWRIMEVIVCIISDIYIEIDRSINSNYWLFCWLQKSARYISLSLYVLILISIPHWWWSFRSFQAAVCTVSIHSFVLFSVALFFSKNV